MKRRWLFPLCVFFSLSMAALAADPFTGTWKTNIHKMRGRSAGDPFTPGLKIETLDKDGYLVTAEPIGTGEPMVLHFYLDGKERTERNTTRTATRVNERHFTVTSKQKGTIKTDYEVSEDGKTLTLTRKGTSLTGARPTDEVVVFDKQ